jgi:FtsH-binding integral membrane protein
MDKSNISLILALVILIIIFIISLGLDEPLSEKQYLINTYMYILLSMVLCFFTWISMDALDINFKFSLLQIFTLFIFAIISILVVHMTPARSYLLNNGAWGVFVVCMGMMTYSTYKINTMTDSLRRVMFELMTIMAVLSYIAYALPLSTFDTYGKPLSYILCTLIIVELIDMLFLSKGENFLIRSRIYGCVTVLLFSGFILFDTQKLLKNAKIITKLCENKKQLTCVDYPSASSELFLDLLNMFNGLSLSR